MNCTHGELETRKYATTGNEQWIWGRMFHYIKRATNDLSRKRWKWRNIFFAKIVPFQFFTTNLSEKVSLSHRNSAFPTPHLTLLLCVHVWRCEQKIFHSWLVFQINKSIISLHAKLLMEFQKGLKHEVESPYRAWCWTIESENKLVFCTGLKKERVWRVASFRTQDEWAFSLWFHFLLQPSQYVLSSSFHSLLIRSITSYHHFKEKYIPVPSSFSYSSPIYIMAS